jgi:hypothetical protein
VVAVSLDSGNKLYTLASTIEIELGCLDFAAIGRTLILACGEEQFEVGYWGLVFSDEGVFGTYSYEIPESIDFSKCVVLLPDETRIPIWAVLGK